MKKCPFCAEEIQDEAILCKHCGKELNSKKTQPKPSGCATFLGVLLVLFLSVVLIGVITNKSSKKTSNIKTNSQPQPTKTAKQLRAEKIQDQFSVWDGSHRNLVQVIKAGMNDPKSFAHVQSTYSDEGDYLIVKTTFRGKNSFGGVVLNTIRAKVSLNGEILQILKE